jgi:hypothetical protein
MSKSDTFIEDLQVAYADVVENIFNCWTHDDDGGCDYDAVGRKQVYTMNNVLIIYQPIAPGDGWVDDGCILIGFTKESGKKLTAAIWNKAKPLFREVEKKLIDSFNGFVTKYQGWMEVTDDKELTFEDLLSIKSPIDFDEKSKMLKMKWNLKVYYETLSRWWNPIELINWKYSLPRYEVYRQANFAKKFKETEDRIQSKKDTLEELKKKLKFSNGSEVFILKSKIANAEDAIQCDSENLEELRIIASKPKEKCEKYIDEDEEYIKEWFSKEQSVMGFRGIVRNYRRTKLITYEQDTPTLSGKKRKVSEEDSSCAKKSKK